MATTYAHGLACAHAMQRWKDAHERLKEAREEIVREPWNSMFHPCAKWTDESERRLHEDLSQSEQQKKQTAPRRLGACECGSTMCKCSNAHAVPGMQTPMQMSAAQWRTQLAGKVGRTCRAQAAEALALAKGASEHERGRSTGR